MLLVIVLLIGNEAVSYQLLEVLERPTKRPTKRPSCVEQRPSTYG
jgi:hypothetical protein